MLTYCITYQGKQVLLLGLSPADLEHLILGGSLMVSRATHGLVVPPGVILAIVNDETAQNVIHEGLREGLTVAPVEES
jgi:hypothetical protein